MKYFVTGCAGFIGSNLTDKLLELKNTVIGFDNLSTGFEEFLKEAHQNPNFTFQRGDLLDLETLKKAMKGADIVIHLAANADVRHGLNHPDKDLKQNTVATFNVLEAMQFNKIKKIVFASTGSIYGEHTVIPTPENATFPIQTSLYGASKLAAEALIQAYCEGFGMQAFIFRFVSILGERYTHGHVFDFYKKLLQDPSSLTILGNGKQKKSYLYIQDCIEAILFALTFANQKINIFNLGVDDYCEVNDSVNWICEHLQVTPKRNFSGGERGWVGDNPFIFLDTTAIRKLGWSAKLTIKESVIKTLQYLQTNKWLLEKRQ